MWYIFSRKIAYLFLLITYAMNIHLLYGNRVGTDEFFSSQDTRVSFFGGQNSLYGATSFNKGFVLNDTGTTVDFQALYPVAGEVALNGGVLNLLKDLSLTNSVRFSSGGIVSGNDYSIKFPSAKQPLYLPEAAPYKRVFTGAPNGPDGKALSVTTFSQVWSVDWSYDDKYLAVVTRSESIEGGQGSLKIFHLDQTSTPTLVLVTDASLFDMPVGQKAASVRWHPSSYVLAVGRDAADGEESDLLIYQFDEDEEELIRKDGKQAGNDVQAVRWHPSGNFLVTTFSNGSITLYSYSAGPSTITEQYSVWNGGSLPYPDALSWNATGDYFMVGTMRNDTNELQIYAFDSEEISFEAKSAISVSMGIRSLDWSKTGKYFMAGTDGSSSMYIGSYDAENDVIESFGTPTIPYFLSRPVTSINFSPDGKSIALGFDMQKGLQSASVLDVYSVCSVTDNLPETMFISDQLKPSSQAGPTGQTLNAVSWNHAGTILVLGSAFNFNDNAGITSSNGNSPNSGYLELRSCSVQKDYTFNKVNLGFNSDFIFSGQAAFVEECALDGGNNMLDLSSTGQVFIANDATLDLRNTFIKGFGERPDQIVFGNENSQLRLSNVTFEFSDSVTTTIGNIHVDATSFLLMKDNNWNISDDATLVVDGVTLWKDSVGAYDMGDILFSDSSRFVSLNQGIVKQYCDMAALNSAVNGLSQTIVDNGNSVTQDLGDINAAIATINDSVSQNSTAITNIQDDLGVVTTLVVDNSSAIVGINSDLDGVHTSFVGVYNSLNDINTSLETVTTLAVDNSDAIVVLQEDDARDTALIIENSNAIISMNTSLDAVTSLAIGNSDAIVALEEDDVRDTALIIENSNAIVAWAQLTRETSDAMVQVDSQLIIDTSDAVASVADCFTRCDDIVITTTTVLEQSMFLQPTQHIFTEGEATLDGHGAVLVFAEAPEAQFVVRSGSTVYLKNIALQNVQSGTFDIQRGATLVIGENVTFQLTGDLLIDQGLIVVSGDNTTFTIQSTGRKKLILEPASSYFAPSQTPTLLDLGTNTLKLANVDFIGLEYVSRSSTNVGGVPRNGTVALAGNAYLYVTQTPFDMDVKVSAGGNVLNMMNHQAALEGHVTFDNVHTSELVIDFLTSGPSFPELTLGASCMKVTSEYGQARLIFADVLTIINEAADSFILDGYNGSAFLGGSTIYVSGSYPIIKMDGWVTINATVSSANLPDNGILVQ